MGKSKNDINHAIRDGLAKCQAAADPAAEITTFVAGLKSAGWADDDIRTVEVIVTRTLHVIADAMKSQANDTPPGNEPRRT